MSRRNDREEGALQHRAGNPAGNSSYIGGATNWYPPSYSPLTGLAYVNTTNIGVEYESPPLQDLRKLNLMAGDRSGGNTTKTTNIYPDPDPRGYLKAIDPMTGQAKWQTGFKNPNWAATIVTAGGLVFTGTLDGEFIAADADTGNILWQFQTPVQNYRPAGDLANERHAIHHRDERR